MKTIRLLLPLLLFCKLTFGQQLVIDNQGHSGLVNDIAFIQGGKYLISTSDDKTVRVWDVGAGSLHKTYRFEQEEGVNGKIYASTLSKNERFLFLGGFFDNQGGNDQNIGQIRVLDLSNDKLIAPVNAHENVIIDLVRSADGSKLISLSRDMTIKVWDIENINANTKPQLMSTINLDTQLNTIALNSTGTIIAGGDTQGNLRTWDISNGGSFESSNAKVHTEAILAIAFSQKNNIYSAGEDGQIIKWTGSGRLMSIVSTLPGAVGALEISNDDKYLTAMGRAGVVFDLTTESPVSSFDLHTNSVSAITSAPFEMFDSNPGSYIASAGGDDKNILIWEIKSGSVVRNLVGQGKTVFAVGSDQSNNVIAFGQENPTGNLDDTKLEETFDLKELLMNLEVPNQRDFNRNQLNGGGKLLTKESGSSFSIGDNMIRNDDYEDGAVRNFSFVQDNQAVIVGSTFSLKKYTSGGELLGAYKGHQGETWAVNELAQRELLLSGSSDQTIKFWNIITGENILSLFIAADNEWVIWSPQGFYEASAGGEKYIGWHINKGRGQLAEFHAVSAFSNYFHRRDVIEKILELKSFEAVAQAMSLGLKPLDNIAPPEVKWVTPLATSSIVKGNSTVVTFSIKSKLPITQVKLLADGRPIVNQTDLSISGNDVPEEIDVTISTPAGSSGVLSFSLYVTDGKSKITSSEKFIAFEPKQGKEYTVEEKEQITVTPAPANPAPTYTESNDGNRSRLTLDPVGDDQKPPSNLYVVSIGVSKFSNPDYNLNYAEADAVAITELFQEQQGKMFENVKTIQLVNENATRSKILSTFAQLEKYTTVDDFVIVFMASHGMNVNNQFYFVPHDGNAGNPRISCIDWRDFSDLIGNMPAKILLFIDTCHSGQLGTNIDKKAQDNTEAVREMSSREYGVVVMAAATGYEYSLEHPDWGHGAFTLSILEGLGQGKADVKKDGVVYLRELDYYLAERVRELTGGRQHPTTQKPSSISRLKLAKTQ